MNRVRDYYQANTWKFLLFGAEGAIHRELWAPGVTSKGEAVHHVHGLVLEELRKVNSEGRARVLDLGCGVGSAALFLAERAPAQVYGVALSPRQVALARRRHRPPTRQRHLTGTERHAVHLRGRALGQKQHSRTDTAPEVQNPGSALAVDLPQLFQHEAVHVVHRLALARHPRRPQLAVDRALGAKQKELPGVGLVVVADSVHRGLTRRA